RCCRYAANLSSLFQLNIGAASMIAGRVVQDLEVEQHRGFVTCLQTAAETLILMFVDNRCCKLLPDMEQRKVLAHTHKVLSRALETLVMDDKSNEWVVCEQLTFASIGFQYLEF